MVTPADLVALAATLPAEIPRLDATDWVPNTSHGLPPETAGDLGVSDLVPLPSHGPYQRFAWLDLPDGEELPQVRGMFWTDLYAAQTRGPLAIGANFGQGWSRHEVVPETDLEAFHGVEQEAVMRVIRLLIRQHAGVETRFREDEPW